MKKVLIYKDSVNAEFVEQRTDVYMLHACIAMLGCGDSVCDARTGLEESQAGGIDSIRVGIKREN